VVVSPSGVPVGTAASVTASDLVRDDEGRPWVEAAVRGEVQPLRPAGRRHAIVGVGVEGRFEPVQGEDRLEPPPAFGDGVQRALGTSEDGATGRLQARDGLVGGKLVQRSALVDALQAPIPRKQHLAVEGHGAVGAPLELYERSQCRSARGLLVEPVEGDPVPCREANERSALCGHELRRPRALIGLGKGQIPLPRDGAFEGDPGQADAGLGPRAQDEPGAVDAQSLIVGSE
jgi:hypothetical protein